MNKEKPKVKITNFQKCADKFKEKGLSEQEAEKLCKVVKKK